MSKSGFFQSSGTSVTAQNTIQGSIDAAAASAAAAASSETDAQTAQAASEAARDASQTAQGASETAKTASETARNAAQLSQNAAATSAAAALVSQNAAASSATSSAADVVSTNADVVSTNADAASTASDRTAAASSASSASTSAATSTTKASESSTSAAASLASQNAAATSAAAALTSQNAAAASQTATAADVVSTNADAASTASDRTAAASSASSASTSAATATAKASEASTSASNAASSLSSFNAVYSTGSSDPTSNLDAGDLFYNQSDGVLKVYTGSAWEQGVTAGSGFLPLTGGSLTGNLTFSGSQTVDGRDVSADGAKLDGIEASATADQTAAEIRTLVENATDSNVFTDADHTKLNAIEASADVTDTANVVASLTAGTGITIAGDGTIASTASSDLVDDSSPQLGGALDVNGNSITSASNGDITIDPNGTGDIVLDANVKIGTTTDAWAGANTLVVKEDSGDGGVTIVSASTSNNGNIGFADAENTAFSDMRGLITYLHSDDAFRFMTANTEQMRLTSAGRLGLGVSSPSAGLHVEDDNGAIISRSGYSQYLQLQPANNSVPTILGVGGNGVHIGPTNSTGIRINNSGSVGIGTATPAFSRTGGGLRIDNSDAPHIRLDNGSSNVSEIYQSGVNTVIDSRSPSGVIKFTVQDSEKMRLDSGNLLVGGTSLGENGAVTMGGDGRIYAIRASDTACFFGRTGADGSIVNFTKDGSTAGSIGTFDSGANIYIGSGDTGVTFNPTVNGILPHNPSTNAQLDNAIDLGYPTYRFKDGYFSGTLNCVQIRGVSDTNTGIDVTGSDIIGFKTGGSERGRFDSGSRFLVGQTSAAGIGAATDANSLELGPGYIVVNRDDTATATQLAFGKNGSVVGSVSTTGSGTTYNTTSDRRLKQDIEPLATTDKLMAMNPVSYSWKADPDGPRSMGFIAQEMQEVMPEAVSTGDDDDAMMSMDYGRITPILVSALQDAHKKIEQLESRIAAMEAN